MTGLIGNPNMARRLDERDVQERTCVQCIRATCGEAAWGVRRRRRAGGTCRDTPVGTDFAPDSSESTG